jgi:hypothetical protein
MGNHHLYRFLFSRVKLKSNLGPVWRLFRKHSGSASSGGALPNKTLECAFVFLPHTHTHFLTFTPSGLNAAGLISPAVRLAQADLDRPSTPRISSQVRPPPRPAASAHRSSPNDPPPLRGRSAAASSPLPPAGHPPPPSLE